MREGDRIGRGKGEKSEGKGRGSEGKGTEFNSR